MTSTVFIDKSPNTPIVAAWLNDVNAAVYDRQGALTPGSWVSVLNPIFKVQADGITDDTNGIQAAVDYISALGGGTVFFPKTPAYYRTQIPIFIKPGVQIVGEGRGSVVYNDRANSTVFGDQAVFSMGAYTNLMMNSLAYDAVSNVTKGDYGVTLTVPAQASRYIVGATIFVRTTDFTFGSSQAGSWMRINKVVAVNGAVITLQYQIDETESGVAITPADGQVNYTTFSGYPQQKCYVAYQSSIRNISPKSNSIWQNDTSALDCVFENLYLTSRHVVYGNSFQRCVWQNIWALFKGIVVELASNSCYTVVRNIWADSVSFNALTNNNFLLAIDESSSHCLIEDVFVNANEVTTFSPAIQVSPGHDNRYRRISLNIVGWRGSIVSFAPTSGTVDRVSVEDCTFYLGNGAAYGVEIIPSAGATATKLRVLRNRFLGNTTFVGATGRIGMGTGTEISDNQFDAGGAFQIQAATTGLQFRRNSIPDGLTLASPGITLLQNNQFAENTSTASQNCRSVGYVSAGQLVVSSTTVNNPVVTGTLTAPSLASSDTMRVLFSGIVEGTNDAKQVALYFGGNLIGSVSFAAADTGSWAIEAVIKCISNTSATASVTMNKLGVVTAQRAQYNTFNFLTTSVQVVAAAWVSNASDAVTVDDTQIKVIKPGFLSNPLDM